MMKCLNYKNLLQVQDVIVFNNSNRPLTLDDLSNLRIYIISKKWIQL